MDVELQILKHLPRDPEPTVSVVDEYCESYQEIFGEVRSYEYFKYLHLGIISPIKRKSFPEIAKAVGINSSQSLHHFIANSPWSVTDLKDRRLRKTLEALSGEEITVIVNEIGDQKKGDKTDYVAKQYLESLEKVDRGMVSINAYGIYKGITFPLLCQVFKPEGKLKEGDIYRSKSEIASEIISELIDYGFKIELVLADTWDKEDHTLVEKLEEYNLSYVLSTRSDRTVLMPSDQKVRENKWYKLSTFMDNRASEEGYIRQIVLGSRSGKTYWEITTDPKTFPDRSTSWLTTNIQAEKNSMKKIVGNLYSLKNWGDSRVRECKQELGWTNYRLTQFSQIEKWWELIMSACLMISLKSQPFLSLNRLESQDSDSNRAKVDSFLSEQWHDSGGWKSVLNDFRLLIQPKLRC
ncbi:IS701 family transposase [Roseofilum capinflatum]|uniref:IS701 family transposase n=1 Tax=Roseofilum capinflatum BLCC-M114 TaxID=3022440 RepID=A0ABT7BC95_9CYAN|nr:IS701 family transposase [Roseofilum capinflatum]MDJ1176804.1 IS701 family transposase [Roseofilum capinflatum BLCC-M114]